MKDERPKLWVGDGAEYIPRENVRGAYLGRHGKENTPERDSPAGKK